MPLLGEIPRATQPVNMEIKINESSSLFHEKKTEIPENTDGRSIRIRIVKISRSKI